MNIRGITKKIRTLPKRLWPLTPWTVILAALVLIFCTGVSAVVIQHIHDTAKQAPAAPSQTNQAPNELSVNPNNVSTQNTPAQPVPTSTKGSTPKPSSSSIPTPSAPVSVATSCSSSDINDRLDLTNGYLSVMHSLDSAISTDEKLEPDTYAISQLNGAITTANLNYSSYYNTYANKRASEGCGTSVFAPAPIPQCTPTGTDVTMVFLCTTSIYDAEPEPPL